MDLGEKHISKGIANYDNLMAAGWEKSEKTITR